MFSWNCLRIRIWPWVITSLHRGFPLLHFPHSRHRRTTSPSWKHPFNATKKTQSYTAVERHLLSRLDIYFSPTVSEKVWSTRLEVPNVSGPFEPEVGSHWRQRIRLVPLTFVEFVGVGNNTSRRPRNCNLQQEHLDILLEERRQEVNPPNTKCLLQVEVRIKCDPSHTSPALLEGRFPSEGGQPGVSAPSEKKL